MGDHAGAGIMLVETESLLRGPQGILEKLGADDRDRLMAIGQPRRFAAGEALWRQGDAHTGIYIIESGRIRSFYVAPSGREVTLAYWFAGNFVGGPDIFGGDLHMWCSSADRPSATIYFPGQHLRRLTMESAPIAVALLDALAFKARCYSAMAQMMGTRSASERLERLLVFLATWYGMEGDDGIMITASFTHADLAGLIGSTRQWVTVQIGRLQDKGVVSYNRGIIRIKDLPSLKAAEASRQQ